MFVNRAISDFSVSFFVYVFSSALLLIANLLRYTRKKSVLWKLLISVIKASLCQFWLTYFAIYSLRKEFCKPVFFCTNCDFYKLISLCEKLALFALQTAQSCCVMREKTVLIIYSY